MNNDVVDEYYELSADDISILVNILTSVSDKWKNIGVALKLHSYMIVPCKESDNILSLTNILNKWIEGNGEKTITLGQLRKTLASNIVGSPRLSYELIPRFSKANGFDYRLSYEDLPLILKIIVSLGSKWEILGIALGLSPYKLEDIRANNSSPLDRLIEVLQEWLHEDKTPTLFQLRDVLASHMVRNRVLAENLIPKFYEAKINKGHHMAHTNNAAEPAKGLFGYKYSFTPLLTCSLK